MEIVSHPITLWSAERAEVKRKFVNPDMLGSIRMAHPNERIVLASGCFDLLHNGHADLLLDAQEQGDIVVIGVNSDKSVKELKGPSRPIITDIERARMICNLGSINYVFLFDDTDISKHMRVLRPDTYVLGEESVREGKPELIVAGELDIPVHISYRHGQPRSTTAIIRDLQS